MDVSWIKSEFEGLDMGDKRLNERFLETATQLFLTPDESINKSMEEFSVKKAAYRLFSNKKFKSRCISKNSLQTVIAYVIFILNFFKFW